MSGADQRTIFADTILKSLNSNNRLRIQGLTAFMASKGMKYNGELMVVGRATNGWKTEFERKDMRCSNSRDEVALDAYSHAQASEGICPLGWVTAGPNEDNGYNAARSAFWQVARNLLRAIKVADSEPNDWSSYLAWSNLYKIAPASGGNPGDALCDAQEEGCKKLFQAELRDFKPKRVLFMTGRCWANTFLEKTATETKFKAAVHVEQCGTIVGNGLKVPYVITGHPQGKSGTREEWAAEILAAFEVASLK